MDCNVIGGIPEAPADPPRPVSSSTSRSTDVSGERLALTKRLYKNIALLEKKVLDSTLIFDDGASSARLFNKAMEPIADDLELYIKSYVKLKGIGKYSTAFLVKDGCSCAYKYGHQNIPAAPMPPVLKRLCSTMAKITSSEIPNCINVNL